MLKDFENLLVGDGMTAKLVDCEAPIGDCR